MPNDAVNQSAGCKLSAEDLPLRRSTKIS
jgi:hypothetical protein